MALHHSPRIVTNGLVLCLDAGNRKSYSGSGNVWRDLAGSNNGTLTNGPTFSSANGGSIVFDGVNDYTSFSGGFSPITSLSFSIISTLSISTTTVSYMRIVNKGHYGFTPGYLLQRFGESDGIRFSLGIGSATNTSSTSIFAYTTDTYQANQVYSLSMVSTGSYLYLYINGVKANLTKYSLTGGTVENNTDINYTSIVESLSITTSNAFSIGSFNDASGEYLNGKIAQVQIYNRALTSAEIQQNYNATKGRYKL